MKNLFALIALALTLSGSAFAHETPAARNCRVNGGQPWTLDVGQVKDLQLCLLGSAQISAQSLFAAMTMGQSSQAVHAYAVSPTACAVVGGIVTSRADTHGASFQICEFSDNSAIGNATLEAGKGAAQNRALSQLLGL